MSIGVYYVQNLVAYGNITDNATVIEKYVNIEDVPSTNKVGLIAQIVDVKVSDTQVVRVGLTEDYLNVNYTSLESDAELSVVESSNEFIEIQTIVDNIDNAKADIQREKEEAERQEALAQLAKRGYTLSKTQGGLLDITKPDSNYTTKVVKIVGEDRDVLERLVMGEAGNQGFEGAALVAQCIKDMYLLGNFSSIEAVRTNCGYSAKMNNTPNQTVKDAVAYVFDQGGYAVKHRLLYFYAPKYAAGKFHETQNFVIEYLGHRFFDRWN